MRTLTALQVALCLALCLFEGETAEIVEPLAVDCAWGRWSEWSVCDPCTKTQRRSRTIVAFGQFNGRPCRGSLGERQACTTESVCPEPPVIPCTDTQFTCASGQCIQKRFMCNGDEDCEDGTDEDCDNLMRKPCGTLDLINGEQTRRAGFGVNPLSADPRQNPFNNDYFGGRCERQRNPANGIVERIPFNVGVFNYRTIVTETVSREVYEDSHSLLREVVTDITDKFDVGASIKLSPTEPTTSASSSGASGAAGAAGAGSSIHAEASLNTGIEKTNLIKNITEYSTVKNKSFIRVKGSIQLSTYRLRSNDLQVAEDFIKDIKRLPLQYEKSIYFSFIEDYGTHYTKNGKHGGNYELVYVLNQDTITNKKIDEETIKNCLKLGVSASGGNQAIEGSGNFGTDGCKSLTNKDTDTKSGTAIVDKVVSAIYGGSAVAAAAIKTTLGKQGIMDMVTFQEWARSLGELPTLLDSDPEPIYSLVPLNMPDANTLVANMKRAAAEYVSEYSVCKCKPCQNGGTPALIDGECLCLCPRGYDGLACQSYRVLPGRMSTAPPATQIGNWACWSAYTECVGGKRSRSRLCNTEGLRGGTCPGESTAEEFC